MNIFLKEKNSSTSFIWLCPSFYFRMSFSYDRKTNFVSFPIKMVHQINKQSIHTHIHFATSLRFVRRVVLQQLHYRTVPHIKCVRRKSCSVDKWSSRLNLINWIKLDKEKRNNHRTVSSELRSGRFVHHKQQLLATVWQRVDLDSPRKWRKQPELKCSPAK